MANVDQRSWRADAVVIGGGTSGAVLAGRLAERSDRSILLVEAGPDYGPRAEGRWPHELVDATVLATTHQWDYSCLVGGDRSLSLDRARVLGGCSAHNGCIALWGSRRDYDNWAALGNPGWSTDELLPYFRAASRQLRVHPYSLEEVTPYQRACLEAMVAAGIPQTDDLNDIDENVGIAPAPRNVVDSTRWNTAFAYLDPVRARPNLRIEGDVLVDRLIVDGGRVRGVRALVGESELQIETDLTVLAAGTYGSPAILLRSGIGDPEELSHIGVPPIHKLPGVGRNLQDHPTIELSFAGTPTLVSQMATFARDHWTPEEQVLAKARTPLCREAFDLHVFPYSPPSGTDTWSWMVPVACMDPHSRGKLSLISAQPDAAPLIDHAYLSDPEGHDRAVLVAGVHLVREIAAQPPVRDLLGEEMAPGKDVGAEIDAWVDRTNRHYYHPVGTCKMGPASDPMAVVDARGRVHGLEGVCVADCSIMPVIPRANTNLPAAMVGERIAAWLLED